MLYSEFHKISQAKAAEMLTRRPSALIYNAYLPPFESAADVVFTRDELEDAADCWEFRGMLDDYEARPARRRSFGLEFYKAPARYHVDYSDGTRAYFESPGAWSRFDFKGVEFYAATVHGVLIIQAVYNRGINIYAVRDDITNDDAAAAINEKAQRYAERSAR